MPETTKQKNPQQNENAKALLTIKNVSKSFGGVQALNNVSLEVFPGEVHGLIGSNGAGKSTLIKILSGDIQRDAGEIFFRQLPFVVHNPQEAYKQGLSFIHQELALVPKFSILQNLTLGLPKATRMGLIDWKTEKKRVSAVVKKVGLKQALDTIVDQLSVADQWLVSIAHALMHKCRIISMDEPTASLSAEESENLFKLMAELTAEGVAVLYVSHRLDEILRLCDGISVFKDGSCVLRTNRGEATKDSLIEAIVGGKINTVSLVTKSQADKPEILQARRLKSGSKVQNVSFTLHSGEVLGIGGLVGAGRTELANLLFGVDKIEDGELFLEGKPYRPKNPGDAIKNGIALVPEERRTQGLILKDSIDFNLSLTNLESLRITKGLFFLNTKKSARLSRDVVKNLDVKTPSINTPVIDLSGGNQQKIVIGKWLNRQMKVIIFDEPSRGVDVGARAEIHSKIRELAAAGTAVIVISSDNEELPRVCDRVLIMSFGKISGELSGKEITKEAILYKSYERGE
ncbi:ribose import ATP-binding protein RbsA [Spirochaetia bacterium]|nr:ribose import ATP-binding protein RbsA [Spirochaetia bacterium]